MNRTLATLALLALLAAVALTPASARAAPIPVGAPNGPPALVGIVGDSISNGSQVEYQNVLGYRVQTFSAANGRTMITPNSSDSALGKVAAAASHHPAWIVIELGVNDYNDSQENARVDAEALLWETKIAPYPCILWVLPSADPVKAPTQSAGAALVRAGILAALADEPCYRTIEYSELATGDDGIHPTTTARQVLALSIDAATR